MGRDLFYDYYLTLQMYDPIREISYPRASCFPTCTIIIPQPYSGIEEATRAGSEPRVAAGDVTEACSA